MKRILYFLLPTLLIGMATSCRKKAESEYIIAQKPAQEVPKPTQTTGDYEQSQLTDWVGSQYTVSIRRQADELLPKVKEDNQEYFDNRIELQVIRKDGSIFFSRSFTKADFNNCIDDSFRRNGVLLGIVFDRAEGDNLYFAASVGSPDKLSDEYIPLVVRLSRMGDVSISRDKKLDSEPDAADEEED